jgi:UDP-N-acetylmuramoyl-tripeptide--D-alanyl-D-alanine ligase
MVSNALAAYTAGRVLGVNGKEAAEAIGAVSAPKMRMERIEVNGAVIVNDSYNANPLSMQAAADMFGQMTIPRGGKKIAVLGDMRELGRISEHTHREIGRLFGSKGIDILCAVGDFASNYAEGARESGMSQDTVRIYTGAEEAKAYVETLIRPGNVILVKGSRALGMERIVQGKKE